MIDSFLDVKSIVRFYDEKIVLSLRTDFRVE